MSNTLLFGGSGFFGPVILSKDETIISVGRNKPPKECKNKHIQMDDLNQMHKLDNVEFDKVIWVWWFTRLRLEPSVCMHDWS